jgi:hypothetical protein
MRMDARSVGKSILLIQIFKRKNEGGNRNINIMEIVAIVFGILRRVITLLFVCKERVRLEYF